MSHLGAHFWSGLQKATYGLDGLSESFLPYHYHWHSSTRYRNHLGQKADIIMRTEVA